MLSYLGSPRNKPWEKDSSPSCLLGRWSQETQGGEWEVRQGRGGSLYRMCSWVAYHCGQMEFHLVRGSERPSRTHTSEFSHLDGKGAMYLSTDCRQPLVEGYSWVGCGINALALATWASGANECLTSEQVFRQRIQVLAVGSQAGMNWRVASTTAINQKYLNNQYLYYIRDCTTKSSDCYFPFSLGMLEELWLQALGCHLGSLEDTRMEA